MLSTGSSAEETAGLSRQGPVLIISAAITKHHRLGGLSITEISISQFQRLEVQGQHVWVLVRILFQVADGTLLVEFLYGRRARELSGIPFTKELTPFMRAPPS